jgi:hypothetical protein
LQVREALMLIDVETNLYYFICRVCNRVLKHVCSKDQSFESLDTLVNVGRRV